MLEKLNAKEIRLFQRSSLPLRVGSLLVGFSFAVSSSVSLAQEIPPATDPGVIRQRFEPPPTPSAELASTFEEPTKPTFTQTDSDVSFTLSDIVITGVSVYGERDFDELWRLHVGKEVSLDELSEIAASITVRYRSDGFVLSRAIVPVQDVTDGRVTIQVFEGYVDEVRIEGTVDRPKLWDRHVEQLKQSTPLNARTLERTVLLLNDLPGNSVRAILNASDQNVGASSITFVPSTSQLSMYFDSNNRGTRFLGPYLAEVGLGVYSWLGRYESTNLRINQTYNKDLSLFSLDHSEVLCACGTRLSLSGSYLRSEPGSELRALDVEGESFSGALAVSHPVIRSRGMNLTTYGRFEFLNSSNDVAKRSLSKDKVRSLRFGASFDATDRFRGVSLALLELSQGLPIFGATQTGDDALSRPGADGTYTRLYARAQRLQRIGSGINLLYQMSGQYGFDRLLAPEQFSFGGDDFGRGYDAAELIGDHGLASLVEVHWGRALGYTYLEGAQLFVSYDYGSIWRRDETQPGGKRSSASSFAFGARLNVASWLAARVTAALPLTRSPTIDRDDGKKRMRFFFGLTARY